MGFGGEELGYVASGATLRFFWIFSLQVNVPDLTRVTLHPWFTEHALDVDVRLLVALPVLNWELCVPTVYTTVDTDEKV